MTTTTFYVLAGCTIELEDRRYVAGDRIEAHPSQVAPFRECLRMAVERAVSVPATTRKPKRKRQPVDRAAKPETDE